MTDSRTSIHKNGWERYLSLFLSFIIVFNITMIPVFAEGEDAAEEPAQEEQAEEESDVSEESSDEESEPESSDEEQPADDEQEPEGEKQESEPEEGEPEEVEEPEEGKPEPHVGGEGKYVKDVYIAYAKTEKEAKAWLRKHKWEPLNGSADFNAGKTSAFDKDVAAVMGIRRTDDEKEAITDMAVMNMKGGYSFPDYESLLKEKKADINEYINSFIPVLKEYRSNYNGKGSAAGKERAKIAHELLNRVYDGSKDDPYAANDTGKPLGDLFLARIRQEDGGENGGDMQQIILESSGPAATMVEVCLALAADDGKETWLERLQGLSGDEIAKNLSKYVPEAEGQDVAPSAVKQFLKQHFGDQAKILAPQWDAVHDRMAWYEEYNDKHDLWQHDGESEEDYADRIAGYFEKLDKEAGVGMHEDHQNYMSVSALYNGLYEIPYEGEWGETLGDFFNPAEGGYADDTTKFLPLAAALSKGQRAALQHVSLETLLTIGMGTEDSIQDLFPKIEDVFVEADNISIYSGINRGIYRGGVALTNAALMEKNQKGYDPFADMWSLEGVYNIATYATAAVGRITMGAGFGYLMHIRGTKDYKHVENMIDIFKESIDNMPNESADFRAANLENYKKTLKTHKADASQMTRGARAIMGVGGALIVAAAMAKGYQLYRFYQKTFTQIPTYIVDEADIVSYEKDDEGNETKLIDFDQFVYYGAVKCNRQEVGKIGKWQSGVSDYASWGCGDASDLNSDCGQQWLALYAVKSQRKGDPVLADSLTLQYGSKEMPEGCSRALHMFTYENAADLGDTAYAYNNKMKGVYFFWDVDEKAFDDSGAASTFAGGTAAIAGGVGLIVGIIGTAIVMRKKKEQ